MLFHSFLLIAKIFKTLFWEFRLSKNAQIHYIYIIKAINYFYTRIFNKTIFVFEIHMTLNFYWLKQKRKNLSDQFFYFA